MQDISSQLNLDAVATALKLRMKQSATDAVNSVSGDHKSPGPPNSEGAALKIDSRPFDSRTTGSVKAKLEARTVYLCDSGCIGVTLLLSNLVALT